MDAAGLDYAAVRQAALNPADVLSRLRVLVAEHGPNLRASDHGIVASGAVRHFGSWSAAFEAAGLPTPNHRKWTPATVIDALIAEMALGLPINAGAMNQRNAALYLAGRRRFGTWAATLAAVQKAARRLRKAPVGSLSMK